MEVSNLGLIISTSVVFVGWFTTSYLNRRHEKIKKQLEYRLITLESFLLVQKSFLSGSTAPFEDDKDLKKKIENSRHYFQLYGYQDELDLYENFIKSLELSSIPDTVENINKLITIVRDRIRKELSLPKIDIKRIDKK
jgi:hypothetical protein